MQSEISMTDIQMANESIKHFKRIICSNVAENEGITHKLE